MNLTQKQKDRLWGVNGPYSQANLIIQTRILDDKVSRIFLCVEAEINPLTFELLEKHRAQFIDDQKILQLLDCAEYRNDEFGYIVSAFEAEYRNENVMREAQEHLNYTTELLIKIHEFVMDLIGLHRNQHP